MRFCVRRARRSCNPTHIIRAHQSLFSTKSSTSDLLNDEQEILPAPFSDAFLKEWLPILTSSPTSHSFSSPIGFPSRTGEVRQNFQDTFEKQFTILSIKELEAMAVAWRERARLWRIRDLITYCTYEGRLFNSVVNKGKIEATLPLDELFQNTPEIAQENIKKVCERMKGKEQLMCMWAVQMCLAALFENAAGEFRGRSFAQTVNSSDNDNAVDTNEKDNIEDRNVGFAGGKVLRCSILHEELEHWLSARVLPLLSYFAAIDEFNGNNHNYPVSNVDAESRSGGETREEKQGRKSFKEERVYFQEDMGLSFSEQLCILHVSLLLVCFNLGLLENVNSFEKGALRTPPPPPCEGARKRLYQDILACSSGFKKIVTERTEPSNSACGILHNKIYQILRKNLTTNATNEEIVKNEINEAGAKKVPPSLKCARVIQNYFIHAKGSTFSGDLISLKYPFSHMANRNGSFSAQEDDTMVEQINEQLSQIALQGGGGGGGVNSR